MTATSFEEFRRLFARLPANMVMDTVHFIPLRVGSKFPTGHWKEQNLNYYAVKQVMRSGGNIGVVAKPGGIMILDLDTEESGDLVCSRYLKRWLDDLDTFTVRTRSGGYHYYFLNEGKYPNQILKEEVEEEDKSIGELRADWQYVLTPGSWVEPTTYRVINDAPIQKIDGDVCHLLETGVIEEREQILRGVIGRKITDAERLKVAKYVRCSEERRAAIIDRIRR